MDMDNASNGTPVDTLTEDDWQTDYGLGKFTTIAAEKLYAWDPDDTCGNSTEWYWWAGLHREALVIVVELSSGAVSAAHYDTAEALDTAWEALEAQYTAYVHAECTDGVECDGCAECENR